MFIAMIAAALLGATSPATKTFAAQAPAAEKMICKREKQIGSLVRTKKICRTKAEWDEAEAQSRQEVGNMQRNTKTPPNG